MTSLGLRVAIVGATTLKGKELSDVLRESNFPARDIRLLDDEALGKLESVGDEVTFVQSVSAEQLQNVDVVFFAADEDTSRQQSKPARKSGSVVVDLTYGLEGEAGVQIRAPWVERELGITVAPELQPMPVVVAHPAAIVLSLLLLRAGKAGRVRTAVATVIEPASERGRAGIDELHEQTASLLTFQSLPKKVFDSQVAFNVIARYGNEAKTSLRDIENRIAAHYAILTAGSAPVPALMLLQGSSFHGYASALFVEMETEISLGEVAAALKGDHVEVITESTEAAEETDAPNPVGSAGKDEVWVSVRKDERRRSAFWLWATADNLRILAVNAVDGARSLAVNLPDGNVQ
jgi:aspartate-semialdehyde dehydrogenase